MANFKRSIIDNLMFHISIEIAELYLKQHDWGATRREAIDRNIPQKNAKSTKERYTNEIIARLKLLTDDELSYLVTAPFQEKKYLLWIALCRHNSFFSEFSLKLVREGLASFKTRITIDEYRAFFFRLISENIELDGISDIMHRRLRSRVLNMAIEAGIIDKDCYIIPTIISKEFCQLIAKHNMSDLLYLPVSEGDLRNLLTNDK